MFRFETTSGDADNPKDHYSAVAYAPAAEMIVSWLLQAVVEGRGPDEYYPEVLEIPEYQLFPSIDD